MIKYSELKNKEKFEDFINKMKEKWLQENSPSLKFIKSVTKIRKKSKNQIFNTLIIQEKTDFVWISSIIDDDRDVKKIYKLEEWIFIWWVYVNSNFRGKWLWKKLINITLEYIINSWYKWNVYLFTNNPIAKKIYINFWFKKIKDIKDKYWNEEELFLKII